MDVSLILLAATAIAAVSAALVTSTLSVTHARNAQKLAQILDYHQHSAASVPNLLRSHTDALTFLTELYPKLLRDMPAQIIGDLLTKRELFGLASDLIPRTPPTAGSRSHTIQADELEQVVREISHALNTPLAQIEAVALILEGSTSHADIKRAEDIRRSVDICKSFLTAFRELHSVAAATASWSPNSLREAIRASGEVYKNRTGSGAKIEVSLPEYIEGYSNSFICAALLPLVQNAVELDKGVAPVVISYDQDSAGLNRLLVASTPAALPESERIYSPGYSTKSDHEGLGLPTVSRLISVHRQSSLTHDCANDRVIFTIKLPARRQ